ncbi:HAMP domain-containing histidine kinase [Sphingomonas sp. AP4-R1]|uniref:sensor histidine kinase n=1 Tax=Sphingomonas sp. AP4-R1 TaxID=2735134 RepID=UPI001493D035|nr:HAMP domain-containing sensor histidine kinase [Sphingomonas sp. AP4-R1]QJU59093.1 HAMP domain-containing histidine kinase [Sphingomonas sp. AP4-R1]
MRGRLRRSLAGQLYAYLVALTVVIALSMAALLFAIVRADINRRADEQLTTAAQVLFLLMREEVDGDAVFPAWHRDRPTERLLSDEDVAAFQASAPWRRFAVFHGGQMAVPPQGTGIAQAMPRREGFGTFEADGHRWRSYGLIIPRHHLLIVIAEQKQVRTTLLISGAKRLLIPLAALILGSAALLWWTLRRGLSAVDRLRLTLASRSPQDLDPLTDTDWPGDFEDLIAAINRLFDRVREAFDHEQALADHAAHQLRTPLAALKVRAQLLARHAAPEHRDDADALLASVDRTSAIVSQMVRLARLETARFEPADVDLVALATRTIADRALVAAKAGLEFALTHDDRVIARTDAACLEVGLAALVDNAIAHARGGGIVEIGVTHAVGGPSIVVSDRGPGISAERRETLLTPPARPDGAPAGLGIPIARRAVHILGATLRLDQRDGPGLTAAIILPD